MPTQEQTLPKRPVKSCQDDNRSSQPHPQFEEVLAALRAEGKSLAGGTVPKVVRL
jgi:hypothetical protein